MGLAHSPKIVTDGLILYTDMNNSEKSFRGAPTTNIHDNSMSIYNNVPDHVTAALVSTSETYRGAVVWRLTLTPTTATGVGYLTAGNNPGIGIVTNGGGGLANRYTGHAIFYKTTVPMHSTPLFTNYSNIAGWGAGALGSNRSVPMGDGWARGEVIWYDTVTRSDGKYWAINPATATINVPIVILWAGPFKEDRNDSGHVAAYTTGTRSSTQALLDLTSRNTITSTNLTYAANGSFSFVSANSPTVATNLPVTSLPALSNFSLSVWLNITALPSAGNNNGVIFGATYYSGVAIYWYSNGTTFTIYGYIRGADDYRATNSYTLPLNTVHHIVLTNNYAAGTLNLYVNGDLFSSVATATQQYNPSLTADAGNIGVNKPQIDGGGSNVYTYFTGIVYSATIHNKALTAPEVRQTFNAHRGRYGI